MTAPPPTAAPLGTFGKYRLLERIGAGAMGEVFRAHDTVLHRTVALKTLARLSFFADDELPELFRREARAVAGLNHPNVVTVYDFGENDDRLYLVMELLEGSDLADVIRRRMPVTWREKVELMRGIASGAGAAHASGVVHRDLKPSNIRVLPDGTPKIVDFGLARVRAAEATRSGRLMGTPFYMSPEQISGKPADARSDVFALGILFYELLTGERPFPAPEIHSVFFQILQREPTSVRTLDGALPAEVDAVLERALAKDPARRWADAGQLADALAELSGAAPAGGSIGSGSGSGSRPSAARLEDLLATMAPDTPSGAHTLPQALPNKEPESLSGTARVVFRHEPDGDRELRLDTPHTSLLELALANGVAHFHECGGRARCSTCRVRVLDGLERLSPRSPQEERFARRLGWTNDIRLACQTRILGDVEVERLVHDTQDLGLLHHHRAPALPAQETAVALLACELPGFEEQVEGMPPYDVIHLLNRFFLQVGDAVIASGGRLQSYSSAGFRAVFGLDGGSAREKCLAAARAAISVLARMDGFSHYTEAWFGTRFRLGVGLDFTRVILGQLGHPSKTELLAIGGAPQLVTEVSRWNRAAGTALLATEAFVNVVEDDLRLGRAIEADLGGRRELLYELHDLARPDAVFVVQRTFERCEPRLEEMTALFYGLLFETAPEARALFDGVDMERQREMLASTLRAVIHRLDEGDALESELRDLGRRHVGYGVELAHYDVMEHVLLETVRRMLGETWNDRVRLAWTEVYNRLVRRMIEDLD